MSIFRKLELPEDLCQRAEEQFVGRNFASLEELIAFLLRELVRDDAIQMDAEEEQIVEQRLRDLGYL